jgi:hypothetical protein
MYRDTSRAAWTSKQPTLGEQESLVLDAIRKAGARGVTIYDLSQRLGMIYGTASARVRGLYLKSLIRDTGEYGFTNTGKRAHLWAVWKPADATGDMSAQAGEGEGPRAPPATFPADEAGQLALFHEARP